MYKKEKYKVEERENNWVGKGQRQKQNTILYILPGVWMLLRYKFVYRYRVLCIVSDGVL